MLPPCARMLLSDLEMKEGEKFVEACAGLFLGGRKSCDDFLRNFQKRLAQEQGIAIWNELLGIVVQDWASFLASLPRIVGKDDMSQAETVFKNSKLLASQILHRTARSSSRRRGRSECVRRAEVLQQTIKENFAAKEEFSCKIRRQLHLAVDELLLQGLDLSNLTRAISGFFSGPGQMYLFLENLKLLAESFDEKSGSNAEAKQQFKELVGRAVLEELSSWEIRQEQMLFTSCLAAWLASDLFDIRCVLKSGILDHENMLQIELLQASVDFVSDPMKPVQLRSEFLRNLLIIRLPQLLTCLPEEKDSSAITFTIVGIAKAYLKLEQSDGFLFECFQAVLRALMLARGFPAISSTFEFWLGAKEFMQASEMLDPLLRVLFLDAGTLSKVSPLHLEDLSLFRKECRDLMRALFPSETDIRSLICWTAQQDLENLEIFESCLHLLSSFSKALPLEMSELRDILVLVSKYVSTGSCNRAVLRMALILVSAASVERLAVQQDLAVQVFQWILFSFNASEEDPFLPFREGDDHIGAVALAKLMSHPLLVMKFCEGNFHVALAEFYASACCRILEPRLAEGPAFVIKFTSSAVTLSHRSLELVVQSVSYVSQFLHFAAESEDDSFQIIQIVIEKMLRNASPATVWHGLRHSLISVSGWQRMSGVLNCQSDITAELRSSLEVSFSILQIECWGEETLRTHASVCNGSLPLSEALCREGFLLLAFFLQTHPEELAIFQKVVEAITQKHALQDFEARFLLESLESILCERNFQECLSFTKEIVRNDILARAKFSSVAASFFSLCAKFAHIASQPGMCEPSDHLKTALGEALLLVVMLAEESSSSLGFDEILVMPMLRCFAAFLSGSESLQHVEVSKWFRLFREQLCETNGFGEKLTTILFRGAGGLFPSWAIDRISFALLCLLQMNTEKALIWIGTSLAREDVPGPRTAKNLKVEFVNNLKQNSSRSLNLNLTDMKRSVKRLGGGKRKGESSSKPSKNRGHLPAFNIAKSKSY